MIFVVPAADAALALTEKRRADPDRGGAEADRGLEVGAHAHGKARQAVARSDRGGEGEVGAGRLVLWRDAHQALEDEAKLAAAAGDEGVGVGRRDPSLLRLLAGVDLDIEPGLAAEALDRAGQGFGKLRPIQRLDHVEELGRLARLVG